MRGILKVVACSDLHWGSPRIGSQEQYQKIKTVLYPELRDAHILFIAGDLYDQLLTVNSKAHRYATIFVSDLLRISAYTGLQVRILHGTFTHDRDQLSVFETFKVPNARLRVINQIECEEITDIRCNDEILPYSIRVGYMPDNLPYKRSEEAVDHFKKCLTVLGWSTVDLLVGHGTFDHVVEPGSGHRPPCLFSHTQFTNLVKGGPIIMGHIHTPGRKRNIYYCGSFDRMAHGEEEKKGFYVFTKDPAEGWKSRFVVNSISTPFVSIYPIGEDVAKITHNFIDQVEERFSDKLGYVRVLHESPEVRSLLHKVCSQQFPKLIYSSRGIGDSETTVIKVDEITLDIFDDVKPDVNNLGHLVYQYLDEHGITEGIPKETIVEKTHSLLEYQQT